MKGSIIKRGKGVYQLRLSLGHDETTGKRIYKHRTVHERRGVEMSEQTQREITTLVRLTNEEIILLDGMCRDEIQSEVNRIKLENDVISAFTSLSSLQGQKHEQGSTDLRRAKRNRGTHR